LEGDEEVKKYLERQKQALIKKNNDKNLIDPTVRIKENINEVYNKLYHKPQKEKPNEKPLTERVQSTDQKQQVKSAPGNKFNTPKKTPKDKVMSPTVKITASPVKKSPNMDAEKHKIRSSLHAIHSISLV